MFEILIIVGIILVIALLWIAFVAGYSFRGYIISKAVFDELNSSAVKNKNLVDRLNSSDNTIVEGAITEAAIDMNITLLKYEHISDQYFFYTKDTNQFVCQGATLEEACEKYYTVNKTSIGCIADPTDTIESFFIINGKIKHTLSTDA